MILRLDTPADFHFLSAVCSHGFFVLAPNRWNPDTRTLTTVTTVDDEAAVVAAVRERAGGAAAGKERIGGLAVEVSDGATPRHRAAVKAAVRRMLRLDEDLSEFHARCRLSPTHGPAVEVGFGRLLRSASLFEDMVKVICTCNTSWRQTTGMVDALVRKWGVKADGGESGFPTPGRLARVRESTLKREARVGYRSAFIHRLARDVADGRLDLSAFEWFEGPSEELYQMLRRIHGIGDYAAGHLCMLLGRYDRLAIDTEMMRLLRHRCPERQWTPATMRAHYEGWRPYQFLGYWFELWRDYVEQHGEAHLWWPEGTGRGITASGR